MTKSFQTTTILYYTFFLPGVFLHEVAYWLVAGMLNVHAKSSIQWPEAQEIAELKLSFVELAKNVSPLRLAVITLAPLLTGLAAVWFIANNILNFDEFFARLSTGELADVSGALRQLISTPDFWLWSYILFTISNTMVPRLQDLRGLRVILVAVGLITVALILIGVGNEVVVQALIGPVSDALNLLSGAFIIIIFINLIFVLILGTIEAIIERITGDSAMFRRGKLVAMTRQEMREMRQRQSRRESRALQAHNTPRQPARPTIYSRALVIPGPPGEEPVTQSDTVIVTTDEKPALESRARRDDRRGPELVTGAVTSRASLATPALVTPPDEDDENDQNEDETEDEKMTPALPSSALSSTDEPAPDDEPADDPAAGDAEEDDTEEDEEPVEQGSDPDT